jgi:hypothetical protein
METLQPPVQLWIGQTHSLKQEVIAAIKKELCKSAKGCATCTSCKQIIRSQHPQLLMLEPTGDSYTIDQIDELLHKTTFLTEPDERIWCAILEAHALSSACANRLLKTLEEPPRGWHFILAAAHKESLLPTIISRCVIIKHLAKETAEESALLTALSPQNNCTPQDFFVLLEKNEYNNQETSRLLKELTRLWIHQELTAETPTLKAEAQKMVRILTQQLDNLPMPGGEKLFWRNLFLNFYLMLKKNTLYLILIITILIIPTLNSMERAPYKKREVRSTEYGPQGEIKGSVRQSEEITPHQQEIRSFWDTFINYTLDTAASTIPKAIVGGLSATFVQLSLLGIRECSNVIHILCNIDNIPKKRNEKKLRRKLENARIDLAELGQVLEISQNPEIIAESREAFQSILIKIARLQKKLYSRPRAAAKEPLNTAPLNIEPVQQANPKSYSLVIPPLTTINDEGFTEQSISVEGQSLEEENNEPASNESLNLESSESKSQEKTEKSSINVTLPPQEIVNDFDSNLVVSQEPPK